MSGPRSRELAARSLRSVWHPCTQMRRHEHLPPIAIERGHGLWLHDADGYRYLDAISSWWVNLFGHTNARINNALIDQLGRLEHAMLAGFTHEPVVALSEKLSALTGHALGHCFYASDGASAVEIALKMSVHAWRNNGHTEKSEFICVAGGYHGETLGALGVTDTDLFRAPYEAMLRPAHVAASPDARLALPGESAADVATRALADVERLLQQREGRIAAVIVEPLVQCAAGMVMHDVRYLAGLRSLCDRYGAHLIADEIAVGCGRSGSFFASEQALAHPQHSAGWPDFLCLSKGISGGYLPLSLVMTREPIYRAFYDDDVRRGFLHSHSYTGNPLACRAALETLAIFEDEQVLARNRKIGAVLDAALLPMKEDPRIRHFRRTGMIWACDAVLPDSTNAGDFSRRFAQEAARCELLMRPIGNTLYLMPPYVLDEEHAGWLAQRMLETFDATMEAA